MEKKRVVEGRVVEVHPRVKLLRVGPECVFKYGKNTFCFSRFLSGLEEKRVRLTLEVL